ncbi:MAG: hypothetical protein IKE55_10885 [Kiritimatiellae bacterium]|nr:hypothetical protein [Kiritimatiellia bacterium]
MKTEKAAGVNAAFRAAMLVVLGWAPTLAADGAVLLQDITKLVREAGSGSYSVTLGEGTIQNASYPASNAFNGVTNAVASERVLLNKKDGTSMQIVYTISESALPGYDFRVCSVTVYRLTNDSALERSPKAFTLEALDGTEWKTLVEVDSQTWDWETFSKSYDIPLANRGNYRSYRFSITECLDIYWGGVQEIVFNGIVTPNLVWNGAAGARWNAADANWLDGYGAATAWIPGAKASFGAGGSTDVAVDGTNEVGGIVFSAANRCSVSGGALALVSPGEIKAGNNDVVASEFVDPRPAAVLSGDQHLPADPSDKKKGAWTLLWHGRNLSGITGFTGATINQNGTLRAASAERYVNNGDTASVQFQYLISGGALLGVKLLLEQNGSDVWGRVAYAKYSYANPHPLGDDLDVDKKDVYSIDVRDGNVSTNGYGLYGVTPVGGEMVSVPVTVSVGESASCASQPGDRYLPRNAANTKTGDAVLRFPGYRLEDLAGVAGSELNYNGDLKPASVHFFARSATNATVQIQGNTSGVEGSGARLCVKVEFTDGDGGVYARAVYAKYDWSNARAHDFEGVSNIADIYDENYAGGAAYGVKNLVGLFRGHRVTFGASSIALDRDIVGDGTVRLASASGSQTVAVTGARTLGKVAFGGATTLAFAPGASLCAGSAEVEDAASVDVVGATGSDLLRIGTAKCLTREECAHFSVRGAPAAQNDQGWIVAKPGMVLVVR